MLNTLPKAVTGPTPKKRRFVFGFYSVADLLSTLFVKPLSVNTLAAASVWLSQLVGLIYDDTKVVVILFLIMLFDWATGTMKARKARTFNSFTFQRMLLNIFLTFLLVGFSTQLATSMAVFRLLHIHEVLMTGFMITYLVSVIENLHAIDSRIVPKKLYTYVKGILNLDVMLKGLWAPKAAELVPAQEAAVAEDTPATPTPEAPTE